WTNRGGATFKQHRLVPEGNCSSLEHQRTQCPTMAQACGALAKNPIIPANERYPLEGHQLIGVAHKGRGRRRQAEGCLPLNTNEKAKRTSQSSWPALSRRTLVCKTIAAELIWGHRWSLTARRSMRRGQCRSAPGEPRGAGR